MRPEAVRQSLLEEERHVKTILLNDGSKIVVSE
jgi:hypothetical protein